MTIETIHCDPGRPVLDSILTTMHDAEASGTPLTRLCLNMPDYVRLRHEADPHWIRITGPGTMEVFGLPLAVIP